MTQVFLNYRTTDEPFGASLLNEGLSQEFGPSAVFFASKSIPLGAAWEAAMFQAVKDSAALLVLMGRGWLDCEDAQGKRRLDDPGDYVRREILTALQLGKQVIPVRLDLPARIAESELPEELRVLAALQDIHIHFRSCKPDIAKLTAKLREQIPALRATGEHHRANSPRFVATARDGGVVNQFDGLHVQGGFHAGPRFG